MFRLDLSIFAGHGGLVGTLLSVLSLVVAFLPFLLAGGLGAIMTVTSQDKEFTAMLLAAMLPTPDDKYVFRDSGLVSDVRDIVPAGIPEGTSFKVDQNAWLTGTFTETSRALTDGTTINQTPISITQSQVTLTMKEYGGPYDQGNTRVAPLGLTNFLKRRSKHDQAAFIGNQLRRDFLRFQDRVLCDLALTATNQSLADSAATTGNIVAGKTMSYDMLARMFKNLQGRLVPTYPDGLYRIIISQKDEYDLKGDATFKLYAQTSPGPDLKMITSGFVGVAAGFMILRSTAIPTVGVGAGSAVTGYQSVAFGSMALPNEESNIGTAPAITGGPIAYVESKTPHIERADETDFGRQDRYVWLGDLAFGLLDGTWIEKGLTT